MSIDKNIDILTGVSPQEQANVLTDGVITEEVAPDLETQNQEQLMGDQISDTEEMPERFPGLNRCPPTKAFDNCHWNRSRWHL